MRYGRAFVLALLLIPAVTASLADYPDFLFDDDRFRAAIVVGEDAPAKDVTTAANLVFSLQERASNEIRGNTLDSAVQLSEQDAVVSIGCENTVTERLTGWTCAEFDHPSIFLYNTSFLVIAGHNSSQTATAAQALMERGSFAGNAVINDGNWRATPRPEPGEGDVTQTTDTEQDTTDATLQNETAVPDTGSNDVNVTEEYRQIKEEIKEDVDDVETPDVDTNVSDTVDQVQEGEGTNESQENDTEAEERNETVQEQDTSGPVYKRAWRSFTDWIGWFFKPR